MTLDWQARYRDGTTPWDLGGPHPELVRLVADALRPEPGASAIVPGCGRGHDAVALANAGWRVTAVDLVPELAPELAAALRPLGGRFVLADVLGFHDPPFDLLWDHTFFCAIEPGERGRWGTMAGRLVRSGGRLSAIVFPDGKRIDEGGPPWGMSAAQLADVLRADFELVIDEPVRVAGHRTWSERLAIFERR